MISVAAIRMQQFGVQFYQASLTANDIDKLVRFEVLSYGEQAQAPVRGGKKPAMKHKEMTDYLAKMKPEPALQAIVLPSTVVGMVTDPATVAEAWGRGNPNA